MNTVTNQSQTALVSPDVLLDEITQMHIKALDMRVKGCTYRHIAKTLNVSLGAAYNMVQAESESLTAFRQHKAEQVIEHTLRRLDRVVLTLTSSMAAPDTDARAKAQLASALVKVEDRRAKLLGLDKPMKIASTTPSGDAQAGFINVAILSTETIERILSDIDAQPAGLLAAAS